MKNLNDDRLPVYELPPARKPSIALVWLLNLIPYTGAGYFYAFGVERAAKPMLFFWIFMVVFGPLTLLPVYFILSALGTAHILNEDRKQRSLDVRLRETVSGEELVQSVPRGKQLPLGESPEFASAAFMNRINSKKQILKSRQGDGDDKSNHALEAFEYKALAAERQLKARSEAESRAVAESPAFAPSPVESDSDSYSVGAQLVAPNVVPEPASVLVNSDQLIPDFSAVLVNSDQVLPEVSSMLVDSTQITPEVSSTLVDSTQITPEVSSTLVDSTQMTPEVSSTLVDSTQPVSLGNFDLPKFEFSFQDHLSAPLATVGGESGAAGAGVSAAQCPKCGAARDTNFSFCLACGQSFL
ncbi:MAG: zinc ribbon domain-containing protein [Cyanobacteria bacterium SZAS LIN-5]|nr:zinc ribbon domain-containing protein [Cyanobacteria bacterium SZAS LIN-5]